MTYSAFVSKAKNHPIFGGDLLEVLGLSKAAAQLQLTRWAKVGKVIRLKRGIYTLPDEYRQVSFSLQWLANTLYSPSYISLEYALYWYDLIPERVTMLTSVSPLKTAKFENAQGQFYYRHLKKTLFFGFKEIEDEYGARILIATKEKALLDTIYLHRKWIATPDFIEQSMRLQQLDQLNKRLLQQYAIKFNSLKVNRSVQMILEMLK